MLYIDGICEKSVELVNQPVFAGITTNPTILKRDRPGWGLMDAMKFLSKVPGERHFVQGSISSTNWIQKVKEFIKKSDFDPEFFTVKLPWDPEKASSFVPELDEIGVGVCATAVYTVEQYYAALSMEVEYVAVYFDRMKKAGIDPEERITEMLEIGDWHSNAPRIIAASIKDIDSANKLLSLGVHDLTLPIEIAKEYIKGSFPADDLDRFEGDFKL
ncbi:transaldolase [Mesotoga sp. Brook.08.105.5.1]|jgi:transaldolase|uniref:transaldolase family protein n=1 Tax=Mesotoga sp. Brook.08.105.5.1 TaxID=1421002 RepID=UPI000C18A918|nr:transaldolase family protein [Mesotoga sp. Brook.08.105.5.1]PVD17888.1 transaldolase [Mesotoga sp. Brook.08.105.5.1]